MSAAASRADLPLAATAAAAATTFAAAGAADATEVSKGLGNGTGSEVRRRPRPEAGDAQPRGARPRSMHEIPKLKSPSKKTIWSKMKTSAAKQLNKIKHRTKEHLLVPTDRVMSSSQPELLEIGGDAGIDRASGAVLHQSDTQSENLCLSQSSSCMTAYSLTSPATADDIRHRATLGNSGRENSAATGGEGAMDFLVQLDGSPVRQHKVLPMTGAASITDQKLAVSAVAQVCTLGQQQQTELLHNSKDIRSNQSEIEQRQSFTSSKAEVFEQQIFDAGGLPDDGCELSCSVEKAAKAHWYGDGRGTSLDSRSDAGSQAAIYSLNITLVKGVDLISRDSNGLSDPYVKLMTYGKTRFKSKIVYKSLNPLWNERFTLQVRDLQEPVVLCVLDHDTFSQDDDMGTAEIYPSQLLLNEVSELIVPLENSVKKGSRDEKLGHLVLKCELTSSESLSPIIAQPESSSKQTSAENSPQRPTLKQRLFRRRYNAARADSTKSTSSSKSERESMVHISLLEGRDLLPMDASGLSDPYVRFRLGKEKRKSCVKKQTLSPKWLEEFCLHMYPDESPLLDIDVYDYNVATRAQFMGRASLDLSLLARDKTHKIELPLSDDSGTIVMLVTITVHTCVDEDEQQDSSKMATSLPVQKPAAGRYELLKTFDNIADVGWLQVTVHRAQDLQAKDWYGKSDPFCVLELVNTRLQTHTVYSTLNPEWGKTFTMEVKDIHSVLEVTVFDEDKDCKREFLGKIAIPLLQVCRMQPRWYALKDRKLLCRAKGEILLELDVVFNPVRAALRTFNPREEKLLHHEPRFKIGTFKANATRAKAILDSLIGAKNFWQSLINWEVPSRTVAAFFFFVVVVWHFQPFFVPAGLVLLYFWTFLIHQGEIHHVDNYDTAKPANNANDDDDEDSDGGASAGGEEEEVEQEHKSIRGKIDTVLSVALVVQNVLDYVASYGERVKNSVNWTNPWLSKLAVAVFFLAAVSLYLIPLRYVVLIWGINKFTKKLRKPDYISNNEVLDYLSRVPTDHEKAQYAELRCDVRSGGNSIPAASRSNQSSPSGSRLALDRRSPSLKR